MGGGGSKSELASEVVTDIMSKVTASTMQNCTSNVLADQHMTIADVTDGAVIDGPVMRQSFKVNINCVVSQSMVQSLQASIATEISQQNEQVTQAVMGAINSLAGENTESDVQSLIKNQLSNDITVDFVQNIVNNINMSQELVIRDIHRDAIVKDVLLDQSVTYIIDSMAKSYAGTDLVAEIQNQEQQSATQSQANPIADTISAAGTAIKEAASGIGTMLTGPMMSLFLLMLVILVAYVLGKKFLSGSGYDDYDDYDDGYGDEYSDTDIESKAE